MNFPFRRDSPERQREKMVRVQLADRGISDTRVLDAMRAVPRHEFVPRICGRMRMKITPCRLAKVKPFRSLTSWP